MNLLAVFALIQLGTFVDRSDVLSSCRNYLAAGTRDGRNLLWDLNVFSIKKTMIGHVAPITCIDWQTYDRQCIVDNQLDPDHTMNLILQGDSLSKSDDLLLSGSSDWNVILWNPKTGKKYSPFRLLILLDAI